MNEIITQPVHPEALFDSAYIDQMVNLAAYVAPTGPWRQVDSDARGVLLRAADGALLRLDAIADRIIRVRARPTGQAIGPSATEELGLVTADQPIPAWTSVSGERPGLVIADGSRLEVDPATGAQRFLVGDEVLVASDGAVRFSPEPPEFGRGVRAFTRFHRDGDGLFGCGGRSARPDRVGQTFDSFATKVGGRSGDYGGFPIPWLMSPRGWGVFLDNPWPHVHFDLGRTDPKCWSFHIPGGGVDLYFVRGPEPRDLLRRFTSLVGRVPEPRRWWLGYWVSALSFTTAAEVLGFARRLRAEGYPLEAMVIDGPWRGGPEFLRLYMTEGQYPTNDLRWHPGFGDGPTLVRALNELGVRTVLHQNSRSYLKETNEAGIATGALRRIGQEVVPAFTRPEGEAFYRNQVRGRHQEGVALWWLDHGDRVSGEIAPGIPSRNLFGALWARASARAAEADGVDHRLTLIRGAGIGGQRHALPWPGDTRYGIDFALFDIWFCLNAGLSGFPITSADLGGFMEKGLDHGPHNRAYDPENLARRLCQALLWLPSPRVHGDDSAPPKVPWNCPPAIQPLYRAMLAERYRLIPYFYSLAWEAHREGAPILRPLLWRWPRLAEAVAINDQFLIGDDLLVAPVVTKDAAVRRVWLPPGLWHDWWRGTVHTGPAWIEVPVPFYETSGLPLFARAGAIIPVQEPVTSLDDRIPELLGLEIFPAGSSTQVIHEARDAATRVTVVESTKELSILIENPLARPRAVRLRVHRLGSGAVSVDGTALPAQLVEDAPGWWRATVIVPAGASVVVTR